MCSLGTEYAVCISIIVSHLNLYNFIVAVTMLVGTRCLWLWYKKLYLLYTLYWFSEFVPFIYYTRKSHSC